jgi:hypothetical protein
MRTSIFSNITPCNLLKTDQRFEEKYCLYFQGRRISQERHHLEADGKQNTYFKLVSCLVNSSALKLEATSSSITSVDFQRTVRRYIPEDRILHNYCCDSLKSYIIKIYLLCLLRMLILVNKFSDASCNMMPGRVMSG